MARINVVVTTMSPIGAARLAARDARLSPEEFRIVPRPRAQLTKKNAVAMMSASSQYRQVRVGDPGAAGNVRTPITANGVAARMGRSANDGYGSSAPEAYSEAARISWPTHHVAAETDMNVHANRSRPLELRAAKAHASAASNAAPIVPTSSMVLENEGPPSLKAMMRPNPTVANKPVPTAIRRDKPEKRDETINPVNVWYFIQSWNRVWTGPTQKSHANRRGFGPSGLTVP